MCRSSAERLALCLLLLLCGASAAAAGQLGALLSPGPLSKAHRSLEGAKCAQCHEAGRKVSATRCLTCHTPVAERIAARKGVHRQVTECVSCHVEHAGVDGDLRHLDTARFNHATEAGYALDGTHARLARQCASCHTGRSYLDARPACATCHADPHKGALGATCTACHSTAAAFRDARTHFDHATARFPLTGAHQRTTCEQCHKGGVFRGVAFASCTACHTEPHEGRFSASCTSCHTTATWRTQTVQHAKTAFPLKGAHVQVACAKCHAGTAMTAPVRYGSCAACHVNVHRESITGDCATCHTETSFRNGTFDHAQQARFPLEGKHTALACVKCHTTVSADNTVPLARRTADFSGARTECASCHADVDPHKGAFGRACDACHRTATFAAKDFRHPQAPDFFAGEHRAVTCEKCHVPDRALQPARAALPSFACGTCHTDPHLGQLSQTCETCHRVDAGKFAAAAFSHARTQLPLTGRHETTGCEKCHPRETRAFPSRTGTAVRYRPTEATCVTCHTDPHLGQVDQRCETCHTATSFKVGAAYRHTDLDDFFQGFHGRYTCRDCHKPERRHYPAGDGLAVRFNVGRACASCHPQF